VRQDVSEAGERVWVSMGEREEENGRRSEGETDQPMMKRAMWMPWKMA